MKSRFAWIVVSAGLLASHGALAVPVTIDFTVTATSAFDGNSNFFAPSYGGYSAGALGSGSFTFDNAVGVFYNTTSGLLTSSLSFTWLGTTWDSSSARIWDLTFDSSGALQRWGVGGVPGTCGLNCISNPGPTDFYLQGFAPGSSQASSAVLHLLGVSGWMRGGIAWNVRQESVPEPATLTLFGLGLLGLVAARRRRHG